MSLSQLLTRSVETAASAALWTGRRKAVRNLILVRVNQPARQTAGHLVTGPKADAVANTRS